MMLVPIISQAQKTDYTISGTLVDAKTGEPLAGANIQFANLVIGTSSESDGSFEFSASLEPGDYTLNFSFIGFKRQSERVTFASSADINIGTIELEPDIIGSEEIVVTGASALTNKKQLGNSISTVNADELQSTGVTQIDAGLSGKISGALVKQSSGNPAGGVSVRLRGTSTLLGGASPLYIVDGVIVNNDSPELIDSGGNSTNRIADLNPEDIKRIEVVKGAAAAALYGSRANNGVVQIFTKEGSSSKPSITVKSTVNIDKVRKKLDVNMAQNSQGQFLDNSGNVLNGERYDFKTLYFEPLPVLTNFYRLLADPEIPAIIYPVLIKTMKALLTVQNTSVPLLV